jgi:hypothetical protein
VLWATLANAQQPPTITLINGDIDGDNEVTLFDYGILVATFGLSEQDPGFNPEADLDGDTEVTLFDFGILVNHFGEIGVDALTGVEQPMEEGLTAPLRLQLSDMGRFRANGHERCGYRCPVGRGGRGVDAACGCVYRSGEGEPLVEG